MYKKIILTLSAIIIFSLPYQQQYAEGAILSKVASKGAQKVVKEVIKDIAIESAVSFVVNETFKMVEEEKVKYKAQQDYELFCGKKMPDLVTCEKPMQVKTILTMTDKDNIGTQSQIELDKLITSGKGFTRWQKFLDWFLPIWVLSFSATALSYAFDSDTRSLFNEAGYNALIALGLIKPVSDTTQTKPLVKEDFPSPTISSGQDAKGTWTKTGQTVGQYGSLTQSGLSIDNVNQVVSTNWTQNSEIKGIMSIQTTLYDYIELKPARINLNTNIFKTQPISVVLYKNGVHLETPTNKGTSGLDHYYVLSNTDLPLHFVKINSVISRTPYNINGFLYYDLLYNTVEGDNYQLQIKTNLVDVVRPAKTTGFGVQLNTHSSQTISARTSLFTNQEPFKQILVPQFDEIPDMEYPTDKYTNENGTTLIPPSGLPYTQTSTGVQLEPQKNETTGEIEFKTPTGEIITNEDDITIGDPVVTPAPADNPQGVPEGTPQVHPPATPSNPSPEPISLTPPQATPTPTPPKTPIETEAPVFPEGESCDVGLKLPKIKPLTQSVTTAFPFSIPFDLYKGFQALFSEIGTEKPSFNLVIGDKIDWEISIPDYFDSWKTFSDGILIFVFDVGLIYAIYRFMSGGGS